MWKESFNTEATFKTKDSKKICFIFIYRVGNAYLNCEKYVSIFNMSTFKNILQGFNFNYSKPKKTKFSIDSKGLTTINERFQNFKLSIFSAKSDYRFFN